MRGVPSMARAVPALLALAFLLVTVAPCADAFRSHALAFGKPKTVPKSATLLQPEKGAKPNPASDLFSDTKPAAKISYVNGFNKYSLPSSAPKNISAVVSQFMKAINGNVFKSAAAALMAQKKVRGISYGYDATTKQPLVTFSIPKGTTLTLPPALKSPAFQSKVVAEDRQPITPHSIKVGSEVDIAKSKRPDGGLVVDVASVGACLQRTRKNGAVAHDHIITTFHGEAKKGTPAYKGDGNNVSLIGRVLNPFHDTTQDWDLVTLTHDSCICSGHKAATQAFADEDAFFQAVVARAPLPTSVWSTGINKASRTGAVLPNNVWFSAPPPPNAPAARGLDKFLLVAFDSNGAPTPGDSGGPVYHKDTGLLLGVCHGGDGHLELYTPIWRIMSKLGGAEPC